MEYAHDLPLNFLKFRRMYQVTNSQYGVLAIVGFGIIVDEYDLTDGFVLNRTQPLGVGDERPTPNATGPLLGLIVGASQNLRSCQRITPVN